MSNVDALLKDGNLNVSVEVLVAVPNPLPQKPPLHPMSLPAISEVAEGGSVEEDEAAVVGSEAAVEVIRTGIPRGCGIEMFYLFDSFTQFSVQSGEEETFAEAVRSIVGAFAQVKYVKQGIAFSRVLLFVRFLYRPTITTFLTSEKPNDRNNIV